MWSIIGHAPALALLKRELGGSVGNGTAQAWLFAGPEGTGKRTAALEFAAALNCQAPDRPCGVCRSCRDTLNGSHPDVELVAPGGICEEPDHRDHGESRDLRICQVRRLERVLSLSPYAGGRRIAIVDAADTLHAEAANAFLKTLEEPPADTVIVLLVEREERLPETVLSRCRRLTFRPLDRDIVVDALIARGAAPDKAEAITAASGGRIGWALRALEDADLVREREIMIEDAVRLARAGRADRFAWARGAEMRGQEMRERFLRELSVWESWWRDVLLASTGRTDGLANRHQETALREEGTLYRASDIVRFLRALLETREYLQVNVDPQLALENLALDMPQSSVTARSP